MLLVRLVQKTEKASRDGAFSSRDPAVDILFMPRSAARESNPHPPDSLPVQSPSSDIVLSLACDRYRPGAAIEHLLGGHRVGTFQMGILGAPAVSATVPAATIAAAPH